MQKRECDESRQFTYILFYHDISPSLDLTPRGVFSISPETQGEKKLTQRGIFHQFVPCLVEAPDRVVLSLQSIVKGTW